MTGGCCLYIVLQQAGLHPAAAQVGGQGAGHGAGRARGGGIGGGGGGGGM